MISTKCIIKVLKNRLINQYLIKRKGKCNISQKENNGLREAVVLNRFCF